MIKINEIFKISASFKEIEFEIQTMKNDQFESYLKNKYQNVFFKNISTNIDEKKYDFILFITANDPDLVIFNKLDQTKCKYIQHNIRPIDLAHPNSLFITPLGKKEFIYCDILPFAEERNNKHLHKPIYIIQGNIVGGRRNFMILKNLLDKVIESENIPEFYIKFIGRGNLPNELSEDKYKKYIILKNNLNFIDFHKEFLDGYSIIPLISKKTHPAYYMNKLTSTINYGRGYNLKFIIDKELNKIYQLDNVYEYTENESDIDNNIYNKFIQSLNDFYN
jgi:hypothetical protein